jgi:tRNA-dihydrouridine synthase
MDRTPSFSARRPILGAKVNFPVSLAPMVGLSHVAMRSMVRRYLPEGAVTFWPTEMLSSWRLTREVLGATPETLRDLDETELVPQILGNEEEPIRESVARLVDWGAEGIDINMGCPVNKALKHNYGVALMGDAAYAARVVEMTVKHSPVPVSVKLRAGLQNDIEFLDGFVRGLESAGAAWVTLHPRVGHMKRRGAADWSQIKFVRERVAIPVVGNGDVQCVDDVFAMLGETGCDSVMVGRALAARPWLLWQVGEKLGLKPPAVFAEQALGESSSSVSMSQLCPDRVAVKSSNSDGVASTQPSAAGTIFAPSTPEEEGREYGRAALFFLGELERHFSFEDGSKRFKFYIRMTMGWLEFGQYLFSQVSRSKSYPELRDALFRFFEGEQRMFPRTQLRE